MSIIQTLCPTCGTPQDDTRTQDEFNRRVPPPACPLCNSGWDVWELRFAPIPLEKNRAQIASWLGQLPFPSAIDLACTEKGIRMRMFTPPGSADGAIRSWAAMTHQQTRWVKLPASAIPQSEKRFALKNTTHVPSVSLTDRGGDPMLAVSGYLMNHREKNDNGIRMWFTGKDPELQAKLQALGSYSYGTESGVGDSSPNPWGMRLTMLRVLVAIGIIVAGIFAGATTAGWINLFVGIMGTLAGGILTLVATFGVLDWMNWRSIPKTIIEAKIEDILLKTTIVYYGDSAPNGLSLLTGNNQWIQIKPEDKEWPFIRSCPITLSATDMATMVAPPEMGETSGVMARDVVQEIPAPPPSEPLLEAPFKVGISIADDKLVGIDPDAHGVATGGSRSGKTSIAYSTLVQLIQRGDDAPGIFLVDPHLSLADGLLEVIHNLPEEERKKAIKRLRIISPDQPEVVPLNLLTIKEFSWAGNAIVQVGRRIWDDYWGPRMQAALLGLFRLAHAWNQAQIQLTAELARLRANQPTGDSVVISPVSTSEADTEAFQDEATQSATQQPAQVATQLSLDDIPDLSEMEAQAPAPNERDAGQEDLDIPPESSELEAHVEEAGRIGLDESPQLPGILGLLHVVFSAYNKEWRHIAMNYIQGADRLGVLALDALLGQFGTDDNNKGQGWITEVVSPILSKVMALELSPWLFSALHQDSFVDMEQWVKDRSWVILRLPTGQVGRESARLIASVVYNVFDAAFRKATFKKPVPFYFVIDEAQEIGTGMRLESMLAEGAKFGARMFVLTQSLQMMRKTENMEALVQSLLANTSTQAFFSPDPDDADTIRAILSSSHRYGDMTLDLPTLQCWLRARIKGYWQPPTLVRISHVGSNNADHVQQVIRDVIAAHPEDYKQVGDWEKPAIKAIKEMIPESERKLLTQALNPTEVEYMMVPYQKRARDEELKQIALQKAKAAAEARGEDPGSVTRSDQYETEKKEERKEPIDEDNARLSKLYKDYPQESHLRP
jgi:hypothetical protein